MNLTIMNNADDDDDDDDDDNDNDDDNARKKNEENEDRPRNPYLPQSYLMKMMMLIR